MGYVFCIIREIEYRLINPDFARSIWTCIRFSSLLQRFDIVPDPLNRYASGVGFDALCPAVSTPPQTCTNGLPVTLGPGSTVSYALVTPTTPLPPTGTGLGYMLPNAWSDANYISEAVRFPHQHSSYIACGFPWLEKQNMKHFIWGLMIKRK
jgi:hypothetical protein